MDWKNILKIDGYKVLIILILLFIPRTAPMTYGNTWQGDTIYLGIPFIHVGMEYYGNQNSQPTRFHGNYFYFILDIIIAYLIGVLLAIGYFKIRNRFK